MVFSTFPLHNSQHYALSLHKPSLSMQQRINSCAILPTVAPCYSIEKGTRSTLPMNKRSVFQHFEVESQFRYLSLRLIPSPVLSPILLYALHGAPLRIAGTNSILYSPLTRAPPPPSTSPAANKQATLKTSSFLAFPQLFSPCFAKWNSSGPRTRFALLTALWFYVIP